MNQCKFISISWNVSYHDSLLLTPFSLHFRSNILVSGTGPMKKDKLVSRMLAGMDGRKLWVQTVYFYMLEKQFISEMCTTFLLFLYEITVNIFGIFDKNLQQNHFWCCEKRLLQMLMFVTFSCSCSVGSVDQSPSSWNIWTRAEQCGKNHHMLLLTNIVFITICRFFWCNR